MKRRVGTAYIANNLDCEVRTAARWCELGVFKTARKIRGRWKVAKEEVDKLIGTEVEA